MKKIKYLILLLLLTIPTVSKAAVIHCSAPSSVEQGETFGVTFYGSIGGSVPFWYARLAGEGNASYSSGNLTISGVEEGNMSQTVYYTAGDPGTASFYAYDVSVSDGEYEYNDSDTCYVDIVEATKSNGSDFSANVYDGYYDDYDYSSDNTTEEVNPDLSGNYYLKSLSVDGIKLSPNFDKEKLDYTAVVEGSVDKINIKAELEDSTSSIEGLGEKELKEGINRFNIKITAQNGEVRAYTITVTRKEKDPIEITIDKKKYTVAKKEIGLKVPEGFTKTSVIIDKQEVVAYSNSFTSYIIVALVDEEGNASWYIYSDKNGSYEKYNELYSDGVRLIIMKPDEKEIPYKYKPATFEFNNQVIDGYALEYGSPYRLVYALNMKTGKKAFYLYDMDEKTFQRFYDKQVSIYRDLVKKMEITGIGLAAIIIILIVIVISQFIVKKKIKRFVSDPKIDEKKEEEFQAIINEEEEMKKEEIKEEETKELEKVKKKKEKVKEVKEEPKKEDINKTVKIEIEEEYQDQEPISKKEMKKRLKEEKKELKKARKEFLD